MRVWKKFLDYDYEASNFGEVRRIATGRILAQCDDGHGYRKVTLWHNGVQEAVKVHRIVAIAFLGLPEESGMTVNHKNSVRDCNLLENLEWVSHADNMKHAWAVGGMLRGSDCQIAILDEKSVETIKLLMIEGLTNSELGVKFGVARGTVSKIRDLKTWKHVRPDLDNSLRNTPRKRKPLSAEDIPRIRELYSDGQSLAEIGRIFGVHSGTIHGITSGKTWVNY